MSVRTLLVCCGLTLTAASASAQAVEARGYFAYGATVYSAADTLDAVAEKHHVRGIGGGVVVGGLWRELFVEVGLSQQTLNGERVFVSDDGEVFGLGIPLKVRFRPLDVAVGWRMTVRRSMPYIGVGLSRMNYQETSDFSGADDNVSASRSGALIMGGVDVPVWRWVQVGGDVRYRYIKGILGEGGVSDAFDEDRLGGVSAAVRVSVGR